MALQLHAPNSERAMAGIEVRIALNKQSDRTAGVRFDSAKVTMRVSPSLLSLTGRSVAERHDY